MLSGEAEADSSVPGASPRERSLSMRHTHSTIDEDEPDTNEESENGKKKKQLVYTGAKARSAIDGGCIMY